MRKTLAVTFILVGAAGFATAGDLSQSELRLIGEGRALYLQNCAGCHGVDVRGVKLGNPAPIPDLAFIGVRNDGFDRLSVKSHIVFGHSAPFGAACEPGEMPRWGAVLAHQGSRRNDAASELAVLRLLHYLEFVQEAGPSDQTR
jgi:mono/diheme cytochrome c family protein